MWQQVTQQGSVSARIVRQVEQLIHEESLQAGDRLPSEREMAQLLGVSRPSLREAVRILEAHGRLEVKHGRGVFVRPPLSEQELRASLVDQEMNLSELYAMREVLEVPAAGWAAERTDDADLKRLRSMLDQMDSVRAPEPDFDALRQLDTNFHLSIAEIAGNRFLQQTSHVLSEMLVSGMETTLTIPGRAELSRQDHERIYAALSQRDPGAARRAARSHIRAAHRAAMRRIEAQQKALRGRD
ncbi:FadR family transcriptional regulator [Nocardioidaceae bacterium SCSIO 66511]|nr:FadR family transcriptional regulator [Nocardioidaceae bacterium SCSIO 66511]